MLILLLSQLEELSDTNAGLQCVQIMLKEKENKRTFLLSQKAPFKAAKISQFFNQITIKIKALKEYFNGAHTSDMSSLSVP